MLEEHWCLHCIVLVIVALSMDPEEGEDVAIISDDGVLLMVEAMLHTDLIEGSLSICPSQTLNCRQTAQG